MSNIKEINDIFTDQETIKEIQNKLPILFQMAEIDNSRNNKLGMEIGSARERIIIALLMYKLGKKNINTDIAITENETDVIVFNKNISIKTVTSKKITGVKLIWTVDAKKSQEFINNYNPISDMLYVHINWNNLGGFYFIKSEDQKKVLQFLTKQKYFKLPRIGTNPRGVEITTKAINYLIKEKETKKIEINWNRTESLNKYSAYDKWLKLWNEENLKM